MTILAAVRRLPLGEPLSGPAATVPTVTPERAAPSDAPALARLRDDAARWQQERGIEQWTPGDIPESQFAEQAASGEWYLLRGTALLGAVRLLRADPMFWGEQEDVPAFYVHGLVASRTGSKGTGAGLLRWVEEQAAAAGCEVVRLDCPERNAALCRYYEEQGYGRVGRRAFRTTSVALYEKPLLPV